MGKVTDDLKALVLSLEARVGQGGGKKLGLSEQIDQARQLIKNSLECVDGLVSASGSSEDMALVKKLNALEVENKQLKKVTDDLKALVLSLEARVGQLEGGKPAAKAPAKAAPAPAEEDDDDVDLFGSSDEEESEEKKRITEERLKAYHEKKSKKPQVIAKTSVLLDVSHGTTRLTTTRCSPPSRASRWMVCFGAPTSSSPSATASRSCRWCAPWRTRRCRWRSSQRKSKSLRTLSSPATSTP